MSKQNGYLPLYFSYARTLSALSPEQVGLVVMAAIQYAQDGTTPTLEPICKLALDFIKEDIDRAGAKYDALCEKNRENARKRWDAQAEEDANASEEMRPHETECQTCEREGEGKGKRKGDTASADADACAEPVDTASPPKPKKAAPVDDSPVIVMLPLNDGTEYPLTENLAAEYAELYPAVDVPQQFRGMRAWSLGHPNKRKTRRGVRAFINSWLNREQNRPHPTPRVNAPPGTEDRDPFIAFMDAASRGEEWTQS